MAQRIVFVGMGGTIAGRAADASDNVGYQAGQVPVDALVRSIPGVLEALRGRVAEAEQVAQLDSCDMGLTDWLRLLARLRHHLERADVDGVVVTHGTDTLEETAYFLSRTLPQRLMLNKPVVLTCAMRPASALAPDGPGNMRDAVLAATEAGAAGVLAVCAGRIHSGRHVRKVHPYRLDPFDSGELSPLGLVEEGRVRQLIAWDALLSVPHEPIDLSAVAANCPWVEIISSHAASSGAAVRAMCAHDDPSSGPLKGIVVAATGNGTIHKDLNAALLLARAQGVRVVRVTRCDQGQIVAPTSVAHAHTADLPIEAWGLTAVKARVELVLQLLIAQSMAL